MEKTKKLHEIKIDLDNALWYFQFKARPPIDNHWHQKGGPFLHRNNSLTYLLPAMGLMNSWNGLFVCLI